VHRAKLREYTNHRPRHLPHKIKRIRHRRSEQHVKHILALPLVAKAIGFAVLVGVALWAR
jgi:hypothetical protein